MIEIKIFDGECIAKIPEGYMEDFMKMCSEYQTANVGFYHLQKSDAGRFFSMKVNLPFADFPPFIHHCRQRHNVKIL